MISISVGFILGRKTVKAKETIKYVKGETVRDTIKILKPIEETKPKVPNLPMKTDTVWIDKIVHITQKVDTAKIIEDYTITRKYNIVAFSDKRGELTLRPEVQYNRLQKLEYEFTPIEKQITRRQEKKIVPFVSVGGATNHTVEIGAGAFYRNLGLEYNYHIPTKTALIEEQNYHSLKLKYKW